MSIPERRRWDLNPRLVAQHTISSRADSAALALLRGCSLVRLTIRVWLPFRPSSGRFWANALDTGPSISRNAAPSSRGGPPRSPLGLQVHPKASRRSFQEHRRWVGFTQRPDHLRPGLDRDRRVVARQYLAARPAPFSSLAAHGPRTTSGIRASGPRGRGLYRLALRRRRDHGSRLRGPCGRARRHPGRPRPQNATPRPTAPTPVNAERPQVGVLQAPIHDRKSRGH